MEAEFNTSERLTWEREILARIRGGERAAWGELYQAYAPLLFSRILYPRLGNRAAAEDALSETFRAAMERSAQFEQRGASIYFWLVRIAQNKVVDLHRARGVTGRALVNLERELVPLLDSPLTPEHALDCRNQFVRVRERLSHCLEALNPRYRRAIELRFVEELPREGCAEALEVKLGTFDVLLLRALRALRKQWELAEPGAKEASRVEVG